MSNRREKAVLPSRVRDVLGQALQFLAVTAGIFAWWLAMLLLVSVFAVNIWKVSFTSVLLYSIVLTAVCAGVYLVVMIRRSGKTTGGGRN